MWRLLIIIGIVFLPHLQGQGLGMLGVPMQTKASSMPTGGGAATAENPPNKDLVSQNTDMQTKDVFTKNPQLEPEIILQASLCMAKKDERSEVANGKMKILESLPELYFIGGMFHYLKVSIAESIFHGRIRHMLPSTFTVDKVIGPKQDEDPVVQASFDA